MHTFRIVRRKGAWSVRVGDGMSAPCRSRLAAIAQAERMAEAIRRHGEFVQVVLEPSGGEEASPGTAVAARVNAKRIKRPLQ